MILIKVSTNNARNNSTKNELNLALAKSNSRSALKQNKQFDHKTY